MRICGSILPDHLYWSTTGRIRWMFKEQKNHYSSWYMCRLRLRFAARFQCSSNYFCTYETHKENTYEIPRFWRRVINSMQWASVNSQLIIHELGNMIRPHVYQPHVILFSAQKQTWTWILNCNHSRSSANQKGRLRLYRRPPSANHQRLKQSGENRERK